MKRNVWPEWALLSVSLLFVFALRMGRQPDVELNPDTSAWISGAISAARSDAPIWTLLTHSDSRPLTVLPLFLLEWLGLPVDWYVADLTGLVLWLFTAVACYRILRRWMSPRRAGLGTLPLLLFLAGTTEPDYIAYNSEHVGVLMLTLGFGWVLTLETAPPRLGRSLLLGVWLGCLPFAKFQTVPMGVCLGLGAAFFLYRRGQFRPLVGLFIGSVLPTVLVLAYYAYRETATSFWNDYFWNYYYYSFTTVYSNVPVGNRFSLNYVGRLFFQHTYTRFFWLSGALLLSLGMYAYATSRRQGREATPAVHGLCLLLLLSSVYAAVQAGNLYDHYTLFVVVPLLLAAALFAQSLPPLPFRLSYCLVIGLLLLESTLNGFTYSLAPRFQPTLTDRLIRQRVAAVVQPGQTMTIWGYADRFFVWSRRAAGNRLSHTFWAYWPSPLRPYRQTELLHDLTTHQTPWFLDFSQSRAMLDSTIDRPDRFPVLAMYLHRHYTLVDSVERVRFYKRRMREE